MTGENITLADLAILATITAAVFGIISTALKAFIGFLEAKWGQRDMTNAERSAQCTYDHKGIQNLITQQNANITKMLAQNGELIKAMTESNHDAQLRHQIIVSKIERLDECIRHK